MAAARSFFGANFILRRFHSFVTLHAEHEPCGSSRSAGDWSNAVASVSVMVHIVVRRGANGLDCEIHIDLARLLEF